MNRQVKERDIVQGEDESIAYTIDTTPWGGTPESPTVQIKNQTASTAIGGTASVTGNVITLGAIANLVAGSLYRVEVKWMSGANTFETWFEVQAEI
jgi:hypothetical protein